MEELYRNIATLTRDLRKVEFYSTYLARKMKYETRLTRCKKKTNLHNIKPLTLYYAKSSVSRSFVHCDAYKINTSRYTWMHVNGTALLFDVFRSCRTTIRGFIFMFTQVSYVKLIQFTFAHTMPITVKFSDPLLFAARTAVILKCVLLKYLQSFYEIFIKMFINFEHNNIIQEDSIL